jgi:DUF1009 family protein
MAATEGALGILAGSGDLPRRIARAQGRKPHLVCAFEGIAPDWIAEHRHVVVPFEKPGLLFRALREAGVTRLVMAGGMARPKLRPLAFDRTALNLASRVLPLMRQGDDALLRGLAAVLEAEGFELVGVHDVVAGLLAPAGPIAGPVPDAGALADAERAAAIVRALGALEIGQGAVVEDGLCLGVESLQGTDALLDFVARTPVHLRHQRRRGVLFKAPKPDQDRRLDLPALGAETIRGAARAGLAGVMVKAGEVLLIDRDAIVEEAERLGLFVHGWTAPA